jgi:hypothetical protein
LAAQRVLDGRHAPRLRADAAHGDSRVANATILDVEADGRRNQGELE